MYEGYRIAVAVPAYNEEGHVGEVIDTLPKFVDRAYVVDDRSTDGTWQEISARADDILTDSKPPGSTNGDADLEHVKYPLADGNGRQETLVVGIRHKNNRGVGGAIKTCYRYAEEERMDVVAVMNGDGQMNPDILDRIIDPVVKGEADYAKGDRLQQREYRNDMPPIRLFGNTLLTVLTNFSSGYWRMKDPQNGYTAISVSALERIPYQDLYDDFGFLNDILTELRLADLRIANVPHEAVYADEESSIRLRTFVPTLSLLLLANLFRRLKRQYSVYGFHPVVLCYVLGGLGLLAGTTTIGVLIATSVVPGPTLLGWQMPLLVFLLGGTALSLGIVLDAKQSASLEVNARD